MILILRTDIPISNLKSLISLVRAGEVIYGKRDVKTYEGWASPTYGQKTPALSLAIEVQNVANASLLSEFIFPAK
jgi:hypothetical protein